MVIIRFADAKTEQRALGFMTGRFSLSKLFRNVLIRTQEKMSPLLMVLSACPRRLFERAGGRRRRLLSHSSRRRRSPRRNGPAPPARIGAPGISELCCPFLWQCLRPAAAA